MASKSLKIMAVGAAGAAIISGCGRGDWGHRMVNGRHTPVVSQVQTTSEASPAAQQPAAFSVADTRSANAQATPASTAVSGTVTFRRDQLFDREFLYGFDLQYTSGNDTTLSLIPQAQSMGHVPCFFRQLGSELQLVADQTRLFESDVNHPELLLNTYQIVAQDDQTLTVKFESGGLAINEAVNGKGSTAPKQEWIRSLTFVPDGDYLLQESALLLADGSIQTFMESVFPRSNLLSGEVSALEADPAVQPLASRYRFLSSDSVYVTQPGTGVPVRKQTSYVAHNDISGGKTIDWYVTPNAPEDFMPVLKSGVEGWNRYFEPQLGRKVMRFRGRLPDGIKIGDPRYNVINFDIVADAGAAYESQATDPMSGVQSHSLIYFPYAWYNIGVQLWKERTTDDKPSVAALRSQLAPKAPEVLFGPGRAVLSCVRSMDQIELPVTVIADQLLGASAVQVPGNVDEFGRRLMMSTLFHEVGHSLGMAHNFKGSLAFNPEEAVTPKNPTTWSIMDYNYYQAEQAVFTKVGESDGPVLEYDRQFVSQLYHNGKDVKATDPVLPACEDGEADTTTGGVDPLCLRYDAERDPTIGLQHAYHNVVAAKGGQGIEATTLAETLGAVLPIASAQFSSAKITNPEDLHKAAEKLGTQVADLINYFVSSGAQALRNNVVNNGKALRVWSPGVAVSDEAAFRGRYLAIFKDVMSWRSLPDVPAGAVKAIADAVLAATKDNATIGATPAERATNAAKAVATYNQVVNDKVAAYLSKLRTGTYAELKYDAANEFALTLAPGGELSNFEELAMATLAAGVQLGLDGDSAAIAARHDERVAAANGYFTFHTVGSNYGDLVDKLTALAAKAKLDGNTALVYATREVLQIIAPS